MSPEHMESWRQLTQDITDIKVAVGRMETRIGTLCQQRTEQHQEHLHCQENIHRRLDDNDDEHERIWEAVNALGTKWKVATGLVGALVTVLTVLNILLSVGVKL